MQLKKVYIDQKIIEQITKQIANKSPEHGGLLMGPPDKDAITIFLFDKYGSRSGTAYTPAAEKLTQTARQLYHRHGWIIKGVVHSHPGSMSSLSDGDQYAIEDYFDINPGIPYFISPVVYKSGNYDNQSYEQKNKKEQNHVVSLNGSYCDSMVVHVVHSDEIHHREALSRTIAVEIFSNLDEVPLSELPFRSVNGHSSNQSNRELSSVQLITESELSRLLEEPVTDFNQSILTLENKQIDSLQFSLAESQPTLEFICLFPNQFPIIGPQICLSSSSGEETNFALNWNFEVEKSSEQFGTNLKQFLKDYRTKKLTKSKKKESENWFCQFLRNLLGV